MYIKEISQKKRMCYTTNYIYTYLEYHSGVCPLVRIVTLPSLSRKRVCPPPPPQEPEREGDTLACG